MVTNISPSRVEPGLFSLYRRKESYSVKSKSEQTGDYAANL